MAERPKMEELKSICYYCRNAQVIDVENVLRQMIGSNPITQQPMVEEKRVFSYLAVCHARGGTLPLNPETIVHQCTEFDEMESVPGMREPAGNEKSKLIVN